MSGILQKIGAEKVKHHLEIEVHYLRAKLVNSFPVSIEVQRGKKMKKETQAMVYSLASGYIQFDYPIAFDITMHKKGGKYVKKNFVIKLYEHEGKNKTNNGRVKIDFSQIPVLKKPIVRREVPLQHCSDKNAVISISVKLEQISKIRNTFASNLSPNSSLLSPNSSVISENKKSVGPDTEKPKKKEEKEKEKVSKEDTREPMPVPIELIEDLEDFQKNDYQNDSFSSKMSFSDLILHPRESEVSSESSSSEEEAKELPAERLVAHSMPKATREQVTPNEGSKDSHISKMEEQSGITTRREGNCCTACMVF